MKHLIRTLAMVASLLTLAVAESPAGVSISIGEPGFYGRIDVGGYPAPRLIYPDPIIVHRVQTWYPPIYLRVPPGHVKQWYRYCDRYGACGRPVYFIDDGWYNDVYVPRYRSHHYHRPAPPPPMMGPPPRAYEYKKYHSRPPKKVYIEEQYYDDRNGHHGGRSHR